MYFLIFICNVNICSEKAKIEHDEENWPKLICKLRHVTIINAVFNELNSSALVAILVHAVDMQVIGGFLLINGGLLSALEKAFYVIVLTNGIVVIDFGFRICANVHHNSKKCLRVLEKAKLVNGARLLSRYKTRKWKRVLSSARCAM